MTVILDGVRQNENADMKRYCLIAVSKVAKALKSMFKEFLPEIVPQLLTKTKNNVSIVVLGDDPAQATKMQADGYRVMHVQGERGEGGKRIAVNTENIEELSNSVYCLWQIVSELGEDFVEFAAETVECVLPLLDCCLYLDAVCNLAVLILPQLLSSMRNRPALVQPYFIRCISALFDKINLLADQVPSSEEVSGNPNQMAQRVSSEGEMATALHMGEALEIILKLSYHSGGARDNDPYFGKRAYDDAFAPTFAVGRSEPPEFVSVTMTALTALLENRVQIILEGRVQAGLFLQDEDYNDEETISALQRLDETEADLLHYIINSIGYFIKAENVKCKECFKRTLYPVLRGMILETNNVEEEDKVETWDIKYSAICLLDDACEFRVLDEEMEAFLFEVCLRFANHETDFDLSRACVWGIGLLAHYGQMAWTEGMLQSATQALLETIEKKRAYVQYVTANFEALSETHDVEELQENERLCSYAADNAISAVEKIARFRLSDNSERSIALHNVFIKFLPLTHDANEAQVVNAQLIYLVNLGVLPKDKFVEILTDQIHRVQPELAADETHQFVDKETREKFLKDFGPR